MVKLTKKEKEELKEKKTNPQTKQCCTQKITIDPDLLENFENIHKEKIENQKTQIQNLYKIIRKLGKTIFSQTAIILTFGAYIVFVGLETIFNIPINATTIGIVLGIIYLLLGIKALAIIPDEAIIEGEGKNE